jgi:hypothetical protein
MPLPSYGLGGDGVHPNSMGYNQNCWFTTAGLQCGYNMRNLITLQALNKMYQITANSVASLDAEPPALAGTGSQGDPYIIDSISFIDAQTTSASVPDVYYKLVLTQTLNMRAIATFQGGANIDISLLNSSLGVITTATSDALIEQSLTAGTYYIKLQTSGASYGAYQFLVMDKNDNGAPKGTDPVGVKAATAPESKSRPLYAALSGRTITINTNGMVQIYSIQGKLLQTTAAGNNGCMQWQAPSAGTYFVRVNDAGTIRTKNIVVK